MGVLRGSSQRLDLLVSNEDLEAADNLSQWDGTVVLPVLNSCSIFDEDDEILVLALVVNL